METWMGDIIRECEKLGHRPHIEMPEKRGSHRVVLADRLPFYLSSCSSSDLVAKLIAECLDREPAVLAEMRRIHRMIRKKVDRRDKIEIWIRASNDDGSLCFMAEIPSYTHSFLPYKMSFSIQEGEQDLVDEVRINSSKNKKVRERLKGQHRLRALECCPVLAGMILRRNKPEAWADVIEPALLDLSPGDQVHFNQGKLVHKVALSDRVSWMTNQVTLLDPFPETITAAMAGRMLQDVIDHPLIPEGSKIIQARNRNGKTIIDVECPGLPLLPLLRYLDKRCRKAKVGQPGYQWKNRKSEKLPRLKACERQKTVL